MKTPHFGIVATAVFSLAGWAAAQPRLELAIGIGYCAPSWKDAAYTHAYTPPFLYDSTAVTSGLQTLSLGADSIYGGSFGLNLVFGHLGIQATYLAFSPDVSGTSSADALAVRYTPLLPPDNTPVVVDFNGSIPMPDPSGELREKTFNLGGFYRFVLPGWFSLDLSAGLSWFNVDGDIGTLDFWKFWLGGDSVLHSDQYAFLMEVESFSRIGGNAGATLNWHMGTNAALWIEARYYLAGSAEADLSFEAIYTEGATTVYDAATDIIPAGKLTINPSFLRLAGGINIQF